MPGGTASVRLLLFAATLATGPLTAQWTTTNAPDQMGGNQGAIVIATRSQESPDASLNSFCEITGVTFAILPGYSMFGSTDSPRYHALRYRFDDAPPKTDFWRLSESQKAVLIPGPRSFADAMLKHAKFIVELTKPDEGRKMYTFDLSGYAEEVAKNAAACDVHAKRKHKRS